MQMVGPGAQAKTRESGLRLVVGVQEKRSSKRAKISDSSTNAIENTVMDGF